MSLTMFHVIKTGSAGIWTSVIKILHCWPFCHLGGKRTKAVPDLDGWWHISTRLMEWEPIHNLSWNEKKNAPSVLPLTSEPLLAAWGGIMLEEKWHVCEYYIFFGSTILIFIFREKNISRSSVRIGRMPGTVELFHQPFWISPSLLVSVSWRKPVDVKTTQSYQNSSYVLEECDLS